MSNVVEFKKTLKTNTGKFAHFNISREQDYPEVWMKYIDFDFRGAWDNFPEIGEGRRRNKRFILDNYFPITHLTAGALMALTVKRDKEAHNELMQLYKELKYEGYLVIPVRVVPDHLKGYVVNLVADRDILHTELPEVHFLHKPFFGVNLVTAWGDIAAYERQYLDDLEG